MEKSDLQRATLRTVSWRLLPLLLVLYVFCYLDRTNVGMAALQMNAELKLSAAAYGVGAGIFFLGYALFEVPSNLILARVGARRWLARIAITWGLLACLMLAVRTPLQFYAVRFLLGVAEAGFMPGVIYYLGQWFPASFRARAIAAIMIGIPLSQALGNVVGGWLLGLDGLLHLSGWQWLFLIEGIPPVMIGVALLAYLPDARSAPSWLRPEQRQWLLEVLDREQRAVEATVGTPLRALADARVWTLAFPYFVLNAAGLVFSLWGPTLVRDALHFSNSGTGALIGFIYLLAACMHPLASRISDRSGERCGMAAVSLAIICLACAAVAMLREPALRVLALAIVPITTPLMLSPFWCLPSRFLKGTSAAAGIALINAVGSTGGFFGPSILGVLKQSTGSDAGAFLGLAVFALLASLVLVALRRRPVFAPEPSLA